MQDLVSAFGDKYQTKCDDSHYWQGPNKDLWDHTYGWCVIAWDFLYMTRILTFMTTLFMAASLSAVSSWQNKHRYYKAKASTKSPCVLSCPFGGLGFVDNAFIESLSSSVSELGFVMGNQANFGELALRDKNYWLNPVPKAWLVCTLHVGRRKWGPLIYRYVTPIFGESWDKLSVQSLSSSG